MNNKEPSTSSYISSSQKSSNLARHKFDNENDLRKEGKVFKDELKLFQPHRINANNLRDLVVAMADTVTMQNVCIIFNDFIIF